jgi:hypothetical protein
MALNSYLRKGVQYPSQCCKMWAASGTIAEQRLRIILVFVNSALTGNSGDSLCDTWRPS